MQKVILIQFGIKGFCEAPTAIFDLFTGLFKVINRGLLISYDYARLDNKNPLKLMFDDIRHLPIYSVRQVNFCVILLSWTTSLND